MENFKVECFLCERIDFFDTFILNGKSCITQESEKKNNDWRLFKFAYDNGYLRPVETDFTRFSGFPLMPEIGYFTGQTIIVCIDCIKRATLTLKYELIKKKSDRVNHAIESVFYRLFDYGLLIPCNVVGYQPHVRVISIQDQLRRLLSSIEKIKTDLNWQLAYWQEGKTNKMRLHAVAKQLDDAYFLIKGALAKKEKDKQALI